MISEPEDWSVDPNLKLSICKDFKRVIRASSNHTLGPRPSVLPFSLLELAARHREAVAPRLRGGADVNRAQGLDGAASIRRRCVFTRHA